MGKTEQSAVAHARRIRRSDPDSSETLRPPGRYPGRTGGKWGFWSPPVDRSGRTVKLASEADRVELKVVSSERQCRALDLERHAVQTRRVYFLDTPDLALDRHGLIVRVRDMGGRPDDAVVKLRPMTSHTVPKWLRRKNSLEVEIDAMPGRRVCSGSLKARLGRGVVARTVAAGRPLTKLLPQPQRRLLSACGPAGLSLGDLVVFGPVEVHKYKFQPVGFDRQLAAERWTYPDGSTLLELSTRCAVGKAPEVAAQLTEVLAAHGVTPSERQLTKTDLTLRYFATAS
ncbi:hypothetical protein BJY16_007292 [Actinoplanes octamycinicus]|uniref:CYTH domain-containing protein n=1 Tax=Actinoplanes octamycinicus TaxID=135948 RepID=A0A7W7H4H0_9ACTN|nr:hypothetical protein [Actinoplanes octamycinicus]MBB4743833.1 hypothetical protein [Actinoplanes octamycinicus]GIE58462.1 hypothetical protein Aoc01nite_38640 [Actinoplanes octamycinicus]